MATVLGFPRNHQNPYGIIGGSFDPPHFGHLEMAQKVKEALDLEAIYLMPTASSPFKHTAATSKEDRLYRGRRGLAHWANLNRGRPSSNSEMVALRLRMDF